MSEDKRPERRFAWIEESGFDGLLYAGMPDLSNSLPVRINFDAWASIACQTIALVGGDARPSTRQAPAASAGPAGAALRNVALQCPTRQSSVCEWSNFATPEADSAGAVNGRLDQLYAFHTDEEDHPWWEVDLCEARAFEAIVIHNRLDHPSISKRAFPLSILVSTDHVEWTSACTISGEGSPADQVARPLIWQPSSPATARYIRLQVARRSILHLVQVEVFCAA